jgi:hypothetical protein
MRIFVFTLIALQFSAFGQTSGTCAKPFDTGATSGSEISMNLRSGDVLIAGTDAGGIRVSCSLRDSGDDIRISFAANHLTIRGGQRSDVRFRVEVPRLVNLIIRGSAGDLAITGVSGDKDVELNAGNLTVMVGDPASYRHVKASVLAGDLKAPAFGVQKDGLFRSFKQDNGTGRYRLRAQLLAGDLTLK